VRAEVLPQCYRPCSCTCNNQLAARRALPRLHAHLTVLLLYWETPCHARDIPHLLRILYPLTHDASRGILPRPTSRSFLYACVYDVDLLTVASIHQCACPSFVAETPPPLHFPITSSHPARVWSTLPLGAPSVLCNRSNVSISTYSENSHHVMPGRSRCAQAKSLHHAACRL
jgi:hypothetical protein